jgi:hypothetical protein
MIIGMNEKPTRYEELAMLLKLPGASEAPDSSSVASTSTNLL